MKTQDIIGKTLTWEHTNPIYRNDPRYTIVTPKYKVEEIRHEYKSKIEVLLYSGHHYAVMDLPTDMVQTLLNGKQYHTEGGKTITMS